MSGFEIAGVVIGVLPLLLDAGKASSRHFQYVKQARNATKADAVLYEFYLEVFYEMFMLKKTLESVFSRLPGVSTEKKNRIVACEYDEWCRDPEVVRSLQTVFKQDDLDTFIMAMERLLEIFFRLVEEKTSKLSKDEKGHSKMCASMLEFRNTGTGGQWHFHERRKFFQKEENRKKWVSQLAKWNKRLKRIVKHGKLDGATTDEAERALCRSNQSTAIDPSNTANHLRILSRRLFTTLSGCWQCQCTKPHEGRFSLGNCNMLGSDPTTCGVQFQFLVCDSIQSQPDSTMSWHEATVSIMPAYRPICSDPTENLKTICEAVRMVRGRDLAFQLHIWDHDDVQVVERPKVCSRLLKYQQVLPGRLSFKEVLRTEKKPSLAMRIKLASTFARSLLQLYESPWSSSRWDKDHLTFFFTEYGKPDLDRPYLSTTFDKSSLQGDVVDPSLVHSNIGILKLGILLIEVYKWKPIEHYRQPGDMNQDGTPNANTDIWVAFRMLDKMEGSLQGYFDSVFGCLNLPWKQPGARVSLEDESTRDGFYRVVLQPLQGELEKIEEDEKRREEKLRDTKRRGGYR